MKKILIIGLLLTTVFVVSGYSIYPTVNWTKAHANIGVVQATIDSISTKEGLLNALSIRDRTRLTKISLKAGDFNFGNQTLVLDSNVIIYGAGSSNTRLLFNVGDGSSNTCCIKIQGSEIVGSEIQIDSNYSQCINIESNYLVLENASTINPGDYIKFHVDHYNSWGDIDKIGPIYSDIGQVLKVISKDENTIYLDDNLHLDFRNFPVTNADWNDLNPRIYKIRPAYNVGIENLYIGPIDSLSKNGSNILLAIAANCRISNIESYKPTFYHIDTRDCIYLTIEGSYFHHGNLDYSGGHAYGILLSGTTTSSLIEDNMFYWLRHAICFAGGANGNVAGYNSSYANVFQDDDRIIDPTRGLVGTDYFLHGHYPFANLFEGNVGHYFLVDDIWGSNGPYNMFYKNATIYSDESFGLEIKPGSPYQNVIGNYITYKCAYLLNSFQGFTNINNDYVYSYHNYDNGESWDFGWWPWQWDDVSKKKQWYNEGNDGLLDSSYYRTDDSQGWPEPEDWDYTARNDLKSNQPAYIRWRSKNFDVEYIKYVKLKNIDEVSSDLISEGYFSVHRLNFSAWYDSIPSNCEVRLTNDEYLTDIKLMQEKVVTKKHHKWDNDRTKYLIESLNHEIGTDKEIDAKYLGENQISFSWTEPVKVYLKDPWYVSNQQTLSQPETFREISSGINVPVFLNEGGLAPYDYPYYSVRTQKCYATQDSIYVFDHWSSPNGKAVFDTDDIENYADCGVRFNDANAIVKPVYRAVSQSTNYTLSIPSDETLTIPTGASITCNSGFVIELAGGDLNCIGTEEEPVILTGSVSSETDGFIYVSGSDSKVDIEHTKITYPGTGIYLGSNITDLDVMLDHVEISGSEAGVVIDQVSNSCMGFSNLYLHDNDIGISIPDFKNTNSSYLSLVLLKSTFSNNDEYGINLLPESDISSVSEIILTIMNCTFNNSRVNFTKPIPQEYSNGNGILKLDVKNSIFANSSNFTLDGGYAVRYQEKNLKYQSEVPFTPYSVLDPKFVNPSGGDFNLQYSSPCIDAGCTILTYHGGDPNSNCYVYCWYEDPDGTLPDIGAHYYPHLPATLSQDITINEDINVIGTVTANNITVASDVKLSVKPGAIMKFNSGKKITVNGILDAQGTSASHIIFTSSSSTPSAGSWYGIRFEDSSNDANCILKYCNIQYAQYGVYCNRANPRLISNTISNNDQGISGYVASPTITDNKITGNTDGVYFQYGSPVFYNNSIASNFFGASFYSYASPQFGPKYPESENQEAKGFNVIKENETGIIARYYSEPFMGSSDPYGYRVGGYNSVYGNSSESAFLEMDSHIEAEYNWWNNQYTFQPYAGCSIDYIPYLPSNPGGGSSLGKILSNIKQPNDDDTSGFNPRKPNVNRLSDLWLWANELQITKQTEEAINIYQILINKFPQSKEAKRSLMKIFHLYHEVGKTGLSEYLMGLTEGKKTNPELRRVAFDLLAGTYLRDGDVANAVNTYDNILVRYPGTESEKMALYNLVLVSNTDLKNSVKAGNHLQTLKSKYPNDELALLAAREMGEKVDWSLAKRTRQPEAIKQILPGKFALSNNYPNPFNPRTTIAFDLPEDSHVTLTIYDIMGREIVRLLDENQPAGFRHIVWDGKDKSGQTVSSGIYLYTLKTSAGFSETKKMALMR